MCRLPDDSYEVFAGTTAGAHLIMPSNLINIDGVNYAGKELVVLDLFSAYLKILSLMEHDFLIPFELLS